MRNKIFTYIIVITMISLCSFIIGGCKVTGEETSTKITLISVEEVFEITKNDEGYIILDVRTQEEYDEGHIDNPIHIPVDELEDRLDELPKDKPIIVYCKAGTRSNNAANILINNGFTKVYDMGGGITEWLGKNYPVVTEVQETGEEYAITEITVDEAYEFYNDEGYFFLDVRSEDSYNEGHIKGAISIPYNQIEDRLAELPIDTPIVVYCSGSSCNKSGVAAQTLAANGFTQIYDVGGVGIVEWEQKGYPMEK